MFVSSEITGLEENNEDEMEDSNEKLKAMIMIKRSDDGRFGNLKNRLKEANDVGRDEYPITVAGAYDLLVRTQDQIRSSYNVKMRGRNVDRTSLMFLQPDDDTGKDAKLVPGKDGTIKPKMTCWQCNLPGHGRSGQTWHL